MIQPNTDWDWKDTLNYYVLQWFFMRLLTTHLETEVSTTLCLVLGVKPMTGFYGSPLKRMWGKPKIRP